MFSLVKKKKKIIVQKEREFHWSKRKESSHWLKRKRLFSLVKEKRRFFIGQRERECFQRLIIEEKRVFIA